MPTQIERLEHLDSSKLIDVARNYRQYGYAPELRDRAMALLKERGHDVEHLGATGAFANHAFDRAQELYADFRRHTVSALVSYGLSLGLFIASVISLEAPADSIVAVARWIAQAACLVFLIRAYMSQSAFYRSIGKDDEAESPWVYILLGIPLYILLFFWSRGRMKEEMALIQ